MKLEVKPERLRLAAQDAHARAVEGAAPTSLRARPPTSSATRSFISPAALLVKVMASTSPRRDPAGRQQVRDPAGEHPGLARAGAGDHQQRATLVDDRLPLLRIQIVEQGGDRARRDRLGGIGRGPHGGWAGVAYEVGGQGGHRSRSYVRRLINCGSRRSAGKGIGDGSARR